MAQPSKISFSDFLESLNPLQAEVVSYLDQYFLSSSGMDRKMKYRVPFYYSNTRICYLNPLGSKELELCFLDGKILSEAFGELEMKNRKKVSGLTIKVNEDLPMPLIEKVVKEAIRRKK